MQRAACRDEGFVNPSLDQNWRSKTVDKRGLATQIGAIMK